MTKRGMFALFIGVACAWILINWLVGPPPKGTNAPMSGVTEARQASQANKDKIADVQWRQSSLEKGAGEAYLRLNNQSDMDVLAKVVSVENPDHYKTVSVPDKTVAEVTCPPERLFLKMRYQASDGFRYQKGDEFSLTAGSKTEITLHKVVAGNYGSQAIGQGEF
jgi:hypothetical protein